MASRAMLVCRNIFAIFLCLSGTYGISGDPHKAFIIQEAEKTESASRVFIASAPHYVSFLKNAGEIPSHEVSSILSLALGITVPKDIQWAGLLAGDIFRRPKANILISVDGVTKGDKFELPAKASFPVQETESAPGLSDILSTANAEGETLAARVSKMFSGKPLTLSISSSEMMAGLGSGFGENSHTFVWRQKPEKFMLTDDDNAGIFADMQCSKAQFLAKFEKASFGQGVSFSKSAGVFTVSLPGQEKAVFDMEKQEDFLLFAEIQMMSDALEKLKSNPKLTSDGIPDVITLTVSSLKMIRNRYGKDSLQAKAAVQLLKSVLPKLTAGYADLYHGDALVEVLTTEWHGDLKEKYPQDVSGIYQLVQGQLESRDMQTFHQQLPHLALRHDLDEAGKQTLCDSLQNKLVAMQSKLKVNCASKRTLSRKRRASDDPTPSASPKPPSKNPLNLAYNYTPMYSAIFNIWLWLIVVIVLSVYVISLVLWYMDPGRDSIIYRMTSQRVKTD
ncbi:predicted protein [Nematostella vectensis]|uniref:Renin receptor n=1 Tax=Nematostella vectensis TaxID=45351 RepID=A7SQ62_NEMVE|nr:predicted protein [Nematostella vectensis]|eukprot:XP_001626271.1 predicted protein [Nematostella vectensis]